RRSSRGGASCASVAARRAIWAAAGWPASKARAAIASDVGAPKIAAPVGLAHTIWLASALQSHAGSALVASGDSLGSRRYDSWNPAPLIARCTPPLRRRHFLISQRRFLMPASAVVHAMSTVRPVEKAG